MIVGTGSRVPGMLTKLAQLLGAEAIGDAQIYTGDVPGGAADTAVMIAAADPDTPGVFVTQGTTSGLGGRLVEQAEIVVVVRDYSGDNDLPARIARCGELVGIIQKVCREHIAEPNAWDRLEFGPESAWHPVYTDAGTNCFVGLTLVATAAI